MTIGERIRALRKEKGLKQEALAKKAEVSRVSIGFYERDDRMPPADIATRIADALEVDVDYLLRGVAQKDKPLEVKAPKSDEELERIKKEFSEMPEDVQRLSFEFARFLIQEQNKDKTNE